MSKHCSKKDGEETPETESRYSHTQRLLPSVACNHMNYAMQAEQRMFERAGKATIVHYQRDTQEKEKKVNYNIHADQSAPAKENAKTLSQIFGAMEQIHPRLKPDEDVEMVDQEESKAAPEHVPSDE